MVQLRSNADAGETARGQDGGIRRFGDGYVAAPAGLLRDRFGNLPVRAIETLQAVHAEDDGVRRGLLERRRESPGNCA